MQYYYRLLFSLLLLFSFFVSKSQTYLQDPAFTPPVLRGSTAITAIGEQKDGKVIIAGEFEFINDSPVAELARLNADRTLDNSFKPSTNLKGMVHRILLQPDGKILAAGDFTWNANGVESRGIIRFNSDGSCDHTFNVGTGTSGPIFDTQLQPDGKILIVGQFTSFNDSPVNYITRLNEDGSIDAGFEKVNVNEVITRLKIQKDGKICIIGSFVTVNGVSRSHVARLLTSGALDNSFIPTNTFIDPSNILLQSDDKIILAGYRTQVPVGQNKSGVLRLNTNGSLDNSFNTATIDKYDFVFNMTIQSDDKIVVASLYDWLTNSWNTGTILRVNTDGSLDNTFLYPLNRSSYADRMLTLSNDKLLFGGSFGLEDNKYLLQLKADGSPDQVIIPDIEVNGWAYNFIRQPDKKIIVNGSLIRVDGQRVRNNYRMNEGGGPDTNFNPDRNVTLKVAQPDGKILGIRNEKIVRLNADGTPDVAFNTNSTLTGTFNDLVVQADNFIVAAVSLASGHTIVRLDPNGNTDNTFFQPPIERAVLKLILQPDGKILALTRDYVTVNGLITILEGIVRINQNGMIDNTFNQTIVLDGVIYTLALQPDGKIIAGGRFNLINGYPSENIVRLNSDGSVDPTFKAGITVTFNQQIKEIYAHPNGKLLVYGLFTTVNQEPNNGLVQLNTDGSLDSTFDIGIPAEKQISAVTLQNDGKIVVGVRGSILKLYTPQEQSINFAAIADKQLDSSPFELAATASSGLSVSFEVVSGPATVAGKVVTLTGEQGPVTIKASQAGNLYYTAAPSVERTFQVQPVLGIEDEDALTLKVYPNPAPKQFMVTLDSGLPVKNLYITNTQGKSVAIDYKTKSNGVTIAAPAAFPGIYILHVVTDKREYRKRIALF